MAIAKWNGQVIAESDQTVIVEGNHYFPPESINREFFEQSSQTTVCGWKGTANYFDINVDNELNEGAAWYYAEPKTAAAEIKDHVAFWKGVEIS